MQPLYSVDHETRQNSNRVEEHSPSPSEDTPLLHRFPLSQSSERSLFMTITVSLLLIILITGVVIGVYLLVLQSNAENILPPVDNPLQLVSRKQWDQTVNTRPILSTSVVKAKQVIVVQTDTKECQNTYSCAQLLLSLQANTTSSEKLLPYNFLVSTNGQTYEALGWHRPSTLFPQYPDSLVLAFIGNFTEVSPAKTQIDAAKNFFAESVSQQHLDPSYTVFGKISAYDPKHLFSSLRKLPQWDNELSDV